MKEEQKKIEMKNTLDFLIYLLKCALRGEQVRDFVKWSEKVDWERLYQTAKYHSIESMVYIALEPNVVALPDADRKLLDTWRQEKEHNTYRALLMDIERENIFAFMEEKGIWYMPLKGVLLKEMYPLPEMRQMTDNDILFDKNYRQDIYDFMVQNGYEVLEYDESNHDEYIKSPVYNFELHTDLFSEEHELVWQDYYGNIKEQLCKDTGNNYGYHFNDEDFYVYMTVHAYNHYRRKGTGLRTVLDYYVYVKSKWGTLNQEYLRQQLEELGVAEFEEDIRHLSFRLFDSAEDFSNVSWSFEEREMLEYILDAGTFGTSENDVRYKMRNIQGDDREPTAGVRMKYLLGRLFPDMEYFKEYYPLVYRHKWLVPFACIYRFLKVLFVKQKKAWRELKAVVGKKKKEQ